MSGQNAPESAHWHPEILIETGRATLVIGDLERWAAEGRRMADAGDVDFAQIDALDGDLLKRVNPDIVLSALVADTFDAVDVALRLITCSYRGKYRAITDQEVDAPLITREIKSLSDELDFGLLVLRAPPPAANDG
ncbi:hypothetical protein [Cognatiyoonia sp. IB215182]|uniref:hypothetical protein n=1 Tax=Cognatiyoonia sp. IB215182 TaxID=3097353 RepID=UPI002A13D709|nr:hypothetical protein [Cognatiyoonia sp. IB215182]MDX8351982.1 hypothetical protein [Cognatiyoonia sp. IB215182]